MRLQPFIDIAQQMAHDARAKGFSDQCLKIFAVTVLLSLLVYIVYKRT